jgi:anaerobic magnesium-protoporphyrin IX monomethyl ester cyclase
MVDCMLIGCNEGKFSEYLRSVEALGRDSGAWRDLNLAFITVDGKPYRSMDILNAYSDLPGDKALSNLDFLWPAITYLSTYLVRRGFTVGYINLFQEEQKEFAEKLDHDGILTVAITTTLYVSVLPIIEIVQFIRRYNSKVRIIIGGPFIHNQAVTMTPEVLSGLFEYIGADIYVISQEGEQALAGILAALKKGASLSSVNNIAFRVDGSFVRTATTPESNALAENMVDYSLFRPEQIGEFVSLRTAKSCPFSCSFCGFPQRAGKYTYLNLDDVERELDNIMKIGTVTTLTFLDDTFNVPLARFKDMMRLMIRKKYGFRWNSFLRSDHTDAECIDLMEASGCEGVFLGAESGSNKILQAMNKTSRREHYLRAIPLLKKAGIVTYCSLIIGFPGETLETVEETKQLIEEAQPDFYRAQLWYCDPTTPVWKRREELGIKGAAFSWSHSTMNAATAAQIVEQVFGEIKNSHWLPQYGFELWSVFYLQRKGMTLAQVKDFVRRFNDIIKAKLADPSRVNATPELMARLTESCQFFQAALS